MSDFNDLITKGPAAAKVEQPDPVPNPSQEVENTQEENSKKKYKPGRPRKVVQNSAARESAALVCYVTYTVKTTIKRIQAAQTLSSGNALTESEIISAGLNLYIKHNKLNIN